jgi:DNA-binding transcriptional regulator YiaG
MTNLATLLKAEISRVARKELRSHLTALKKAVATHRAEIAALKRRAQAAETQVRRLTRASGKPAAAAADEEATPSRQMRFSGSALKALRQRLNLSARECGILIGVSGLSIYHWEAGKARPRAKHMPAIAALRSMSKKQAAEKLATL